MVCQWPLYVLKRWFAGGQTYPLNSDCLLIGVVSKSLRSVTGHSSLQSWPDHLNLQATDAFDHV